MDQNHCTPMVHDARIQLTETADAEVYDKSPDEDKIYNEVKRRFGLGTVSDFRERESSLEVGGWGWIPEVQNEEG